MNIGSQRLGLITYMRTDSTRVAESALEEVRAYIGEAFPGELPAEAVRYVAGKGTQDAHEAIRPTFVTRTPAELKKHLTTDEFRLYSMIWERFVSSQMNPAKTVTDHGGDRRGCRGHGVHLPRLEHEGGREGLPEGPHRPGLARGRPRRCRPSPPARPWPA